MPASAAGAPRAPLESTRDQGEGGSMGVLAVITKTRSQ